MFIKKLKPGEFGYIPVLSENALILESDIKDANKIIDGMEQIDVTYAPNIDRGADTFVIVVTTAGNFYVVDHKIKFSSKKVPKQYDMLFRNLLSSFRLAYMSIGQDIGTFGAEIRNIKQYVDTLKAA